nr:acyl carrier protein [Microbispora sp.]
MRDEEAEERILSFIREKFLDGDPRGELDLDSPLLEWGVLNSMDTMVLISFIRDEMGLEVPFERINSRDLKNVRSIAQMLVELSAQAQGAGR